MMTVENRHLDRLFKAGYILLVVLSVFVVALLFNTLKEFKYIGGGVYPSSTISVTGEGEAFAVPDVARVSFTVSEEASDVPTAQDNAAEIINKILADLEVFGIEEADIKTTSYNVFPRYEFRRETIACVTAPCPQPPGRQVLVGHEVSQSVELTIRDTERAGEVLTILGQSGADNVSGLRFEVEDEDVVIAEARTLAIADAEAKARKLTDDLGVRLVRVIGFNEFGGQPYYDYGYGGEFAVLENKDSAATIPGLPEGENKFMVNVNVIYEIR